MALMNLAQSFRVTNRPGGCFATKVDLYFSQKDATLPVTVSIREMRNGKPTQRSLPFSSVTKFPSSTGAPSSDLATHVHSFGIVDSDFTTADAATQPTTFHFRSPVFLKNDVEYCLVITPAGNSKNYKVWVAKLGEFDAGTTNIIAKQPAVGTLFLSADGRNYTESQDIDLSFNMYAATFEDSGTLVQENEKFDDLTVSSIQGNFQVGELVFGNTSSANTFANTAGVGIVKSYSANDTVKLVLTNRLGSRFTSGMRVNGAESNAIATINGINDHLQDVVHYNFGIINPPDTVLSTDLKATSNGNVTDSSFETKIELNKDNEMISVKKVLSYSNEITNNSGKKSSLVRSAMSTVNTNLSPAIDVEKATSYVINNLVNNVSTGETAKSGGDAAARYITRRVTLTENQTAEDLNVFLTAYKPDKTDIKVYYKILNSLDSDDFDDKSYVEMTQSTNTGVNSVEKKLDDFIEYKYVIASANKTGTNGEVVYTNAAGSSFTGFNTFALKIVMLSSTDVVVPQIRDMRAIALQI